jgi:hypothetical protein
MHKLNDVIRSAPILSKFNVNIIVEPLVFYTFIKNLLNRIWVFVVVQYIVVCKYRMFVDLASPCFAFVFIVA